MWTALVESIGSPERFEAARHKIRQDVLKSISALRQVSDKALITRLSESDTYLSFLFGLLDELPVTADSHVSGELQAMRQEMQEMNRLHKNEFLQRELNAIQFCSEENLDPVLQDIRVKIKCLSWLKNHPR